MDAAFDQIQAQAVVAITANDVQELYSQAYPAVKHTDNLVTTESLDNIYGVRTCKQMFGRLMCYFRQIYAFSPITSVPQYYSIQKHMDRMYYESLRQTTFLTQFPMQIQCKARVIILVGSHDCFMTEDIVNSTQTMVRSTSGQDAEIYVRQISGAGHDLFSICQRLFLRMLK